MGRNRRDCQSPAPSPATCSSSGPAGIDESDAFVLVEAFADDDAAGAHVNSEYFATATRETLAHALVATPKIVSRKVDGAGWG